MGEALRKADDEFLSIILDLANYMIETNYFPSRVKQNYLAPLYKRGDVTDPRNYRGIVFANYMFNLVSSWFTYRFQRWVWVQNILPGLTYYRAFKSQRNKVF